jgi:hypothetical protein
VSIFDGVISVDKGRKTKQVPIVMATRAAGITQLESFTEPKVGASITHSLPGMAIGESDDKHDDNGQDINELEGSADLLLQGHIFYPGSVEDDLDSEGNNAAAVIKGTICSKKLYNRLK